MASDIHPLAVCPSLRGQEGVNCVCGVGELQATDTTDIETDRGAGRNRDRERGGDWEIKKRGGTEIESLTEGSRDRIMKSLNEPKLQCQ